MVRLPIIVCCVHFFVISWSSIVANQRIVDVEASVAETMVLRTADPEFDSVDDTLLFLLRAMQALHYKQISVAAELRGGLDCTENRYREAGKLLNVHNGHNGWIGDEALHQFLHHIVSQLSVHSNAGQDQSISEKADAY